MFLKSGRACHVDYTVPAGALTIGVAPAQKVEWIGRDEGGVRIAGPHTQSIYIENTGANPLLVSFNNIHFLTIPAGAGRDFTVDAPFIWMKVAAGTTTFTALVVLRQADR